MEEDKTKSQMQEDEEAEESAAGATEDESEDEQQEDESQETEEIEDAGDEDTSDEEEEPAPSPRQNKAIERLTKRLAEAQSHQEQPLSSAQKKQIISEGDYDIDELNGIAEKYGEERYNEGVSKAEAIQFQTRLDIDAPRVAAKYPVMNQDSDQFNPGIADLINSTYLATVGFDNRTGAVKNNNIRYSEYVEGMMELVDTLASVKASDSTENVRKQASKLGVRPGGAVKKSYTGNDPRKMTDEQLTRQINDMLGIKPR